nr:YheC/YheD family protein [Paenibacillus protaetiae]
MQADQRTKAYIPHTAFLTPSRLLRMLADYGAAYVKPNIGSQGIGVCKVQKDEEGFTLDTTRKKRQIRKHFRTSKSLLRYLKSLTPYRMIIQAPIDLGRVLNKPYDIRSMVQRKPKGKWTCTGFLVKVGSPNKIVTNYHQGGRIWSIDKLLRKLNIPEEERSGEIERLKHASLNIARVLSSKRSGMQEMGIDFAIDQNKKLWVLEVNSNHPQFHPLKRINPSEYKRMARFARSYGRYDD